MSNERGMTQPADFPILSLNQLDEMSSLVFQARMQHAEKRWNLVKSKFPGVAETIEDLIEKEERTNV